MVWLDVITSRHVMSFITSPTMRPLRFQWGIKVGHAMVVGVDAAAGGGDAVWATWGRICCSRAEFMTAMLTSWMG